MLEHDLWQFEQIFNNTEEFIIYCCISIHILLTGYS